MRKLFFLAGLSALALTGCVSENEVDVQSSFNNVIGFESVVNKATRDGVVGDLTKENFDRFLVYGYYTPANKVSALQIFDNEPVVKGITSDGVTSWNYSSHQRYWVPGATYYFYAYSCGDIALDNKFGTPSMSLTNTDAESRVLRITNYVCSDSHQHDLIYAKQEGTIGKDVVGTPENPGVGTSNQNVKFQFQHLLSKIDAKFISDMPNDYEVVISNVRIENIRNYGTYNPNSGWSIPQRNSDYSTTLTLKVDDDYDIARAEFTTTGQNPENPEGDPITVTHPQVDVQTAHGYVIPFDYQEGDVQLKFTIALYKNGVEALSRNLSASWSPTWELGKNYTYAITISGDASGLQAIAFETAEDPITGWSEGQNIPTLNFSGGAAN